MIKPILSYDNEKDKIILSSVSAPVENVLSTDTKEIIQDLKDTLAATDNGKGLSAVQIGVLKRICICSWGGKEIVLINPIITHSRGEKEYLEGCLSVPNKYKKIKRAQKVWCSYLDENGETQEIAEGGRMSNIIQHELDHFNGVCKIYEE